MVKNCPLCNGKMKITELKCGDCGLEIKKDFELDPFSTLTAEQNNFLVTFLKCEGNLTEMQKKLDINYTSVKRKISNLLDALELKDNMPDKNINWSVNKNSNKASEIVKAFFAKECGIAKIETNGTSIKPIIKLKTIETISIALYFNSFSFLTKIIVTIRASSEISNVGSTISPLK